MQRILKLIIFVGEREMDVSPLCCLAPLLFIRLIGITGVPGSWSYSTISHRFERVCVCDWKLGSYCERGRGNKNEQKRSPETLLSCSAQDPKVDRTHYTMWFTDFVGEYVNVGLILRSVISNNPVWTPVSFYSEEASSFFLIWYICVLKLLSWSLIRLNHFSNLKHFNTAGQLCKSSASLLRQTDWIKHVIAHLFAASSCYLLVLFSINPSLLEKTTTSKLAVYTLNLVSYSHANLFANRTNINKWAAITFSFSGI